MLQDVRTRWVGYREDGKKRGGCNSSSPWLVAASRGQAWLARRIQGTSTDQPRCRGAGQHGLSIGLAQHILCTTRTHPIYTHPSTHPVRPTLRFLVGRHIQADPPGGGLDAVLLRHAIQRVVPLHERVVHALAAQEQLEVRERLQLAVLHAQDACQLADRRVLCVFARRKLGKKCDVPRCAARGISCRTARVSWRASPRPRARPSRRAPRTLSGRPTTS